jgi:hypothetical protein
MPQGGGSAANASPPVSGTTHTTTRGRLIAVGERIDGAFVKGRPPTDRANLEIITGRIEADAEPSKAFAVVRDQDGHAEQHAQALLRQRGKDLEIKLRVVSDGEDGMRSFGG